MAPSHTSALIVASIESEPPWLYFLGLAILRPVLLHVELHILEDNRSEYPIVRGNAQRLRAEGDIVGILAGALQRSTKPITLPKPISRHSLRAPFREWPRPALPQPAPPRTMADGVGGRSLRNISEKMPNNCQKTTIVVSTPPP